MYVSGVEGSGKAHYLFRRISEIQINTSDGKEISGLRVFAFVKDDELNAFYNDLCSFFSSEACTLIFAANIFMFPFDDVERRVFAIDRIRNLKNFIVCATDLSINSSVLDPKSDVGVNIIKNQKYNLSDLEYSLVSFGYMKTDFVENKLQFAVRGGILDVWPYLNELPVRVVFEFDNVEVIKVFDPKTQLSNSFINEIKILPIDLSKCKSKSTIKDYFVNQNMISDQTAVILFFDYPIDKEIEKSFSKYDLIINNSLNINAQYQGYKSFVGFRGNKDFFIKMFRSFAEVNTMIRICCANESEHECIMNIFDESQFDYKNLKFLYNDLSQGFYLESLKIAYIPAKEMLYKKKTMSFPKIKCGKRLEGMWEISTGDYVVHEKYGIGRYTGLKTLSRESIISEYLCIEYKNDDKLYIPLERINTVKKYIGLEGVKPKLYSMDTVAWERVKLVAREAAAKFAKELLKLYVQRSMIKRDPFDVETAWEKELADSFPYDETSDQLKAINDIKDDFLKPYPMERLVCGDVGYGKTEIAVRAAFKVVQYGFQVAVLVPTTILAQQHYNKFCNRLSLFQVKVAMISRFQSKVKQREIIKDLQGGLVDIIIGTHRLLRQDVKFKNLGLLVIDEEHRFGVKQKEKVKLIKKNVDILMLSATPIPRTLSSALSGFRDLSVIETPPFGRLPIDTHLSLYDENLIRNIIEAELSRGGQIFYVYNEVETIVIKAASIRSLIPNVRLGIVHGQMKTKDIEDIMWKFLNMELDILLATTIIESGLDIPSVNTIVVEGAENFGLSQLYQLRGRVGRDRKKAYCYLFYKDKNLNENAIRRLEAMKEFSELGSGFRLALKDLEIRGAGGILSANQHGFVKDIGYDMFAKLLEEEGEKLKGNNISDRMQEEENTVIDLSISALIPSKYIENENIRILFYRKLNVAKDMEALEQLKDELLDRFGKMPKETQMLFEIAWLRLNAKKLRIEKIVEDSAHIWLYFSQKVNLSEVDMAKLVSDYSKILEFMPSRSYTIGLKKNMININTVEYLKEFLYSIKFYGFK
ncbi:MAG: transcription-repair coupling factor [Endomicrobium sp.]|jgi:transcription-repair coupling factor (superfamily II helicase)|nr:transcription-repair coupling factor [Endomicrobium sp.]